MVETFIDTVITQSPYGRYAEKNRTAKFTTIGNGLRSLVPSASDHAVTTIADVMAFRYGISNIHYHAEEARDSVQQLYEDLFFPQQDFSPQAVEQLRELAISHESLKNRVKEVEVPINEDLQVKIIYGDSDWEGIGAVHFLAKDSRSQTYYPLYIVRGNPLARDEFSFKIRSIQPWVSDSVAAVRWFKTPFFEEMLPQEQVGQIKTAIQERQRLLDKLTRAMNRGETIANNKDLLLTQELILLMTLVYLQGAGVTTIEAITHGAHKKSNYFSFNYDTLFEKWFEIQDDEIYPWIIRGNKGKGYVPKFSFLPGTTRRVLIDTYTAFSH